MLRKACAAWHSLQPSFNKLAQPDDSHPLGGRGGMNILDIEKGDAVFNISGRSTCSRSCVAFWLMLVAPDLSYGVALTAPCPFLLRPHQQNSAILNVRATLQTPSHRPCDEDAIVQIPLVSYPWQCNAGNICIALTFHPILVPPLLTSTHPCLTFHSP